MSDEVVAGELRWYPPGAAHALVISVPLLFG
jgi:hypothetical protein